MLYDIDFAQEAPEESPRSEYRTDALPAQNRPVAPCRGILASRHARIAYYMERLPRDLTIREALLVARILVYEDEHGIEA